MDTGGPYHVKVTQQTVALPIKQSFKYSSKRYGHINGNYIEKPLDTVNNKQII